MKAERWKLVDALLQAALEVPPQDRDPFLQQACAGDSEIMAEVKSLLTSHRKAGDFLQSPAARFGATDIAEEDTSSLSLAGQVISHYRILKMIGSGGMGVVYSAEDLKLGRKVAVKLLPPKLALEPGAFERLQREARAASSLDQPNICSIYELAEHEGQPFIVMQLLEGETLREVIASFVAQHDPIPIASVLDWAIEIAEALEAAHQKGVIHRDIKPANVFITSHGRVKILDFGVAKLADPELFESIVHAKETTSEPGQRTHLLRESDLTASGVSVGTPSYFSPEQARGEKLDARTDLFSFGLLLYEVATGQRALPQDSGDSNRQAVLHDSIPGVRRVNPGLPPELERIITKALEKDREIRYQGAGEIKADLVRLRDSFTSPSAIGEPSQRKRVTTAVLVTLLLIIFTAGILRYKAHRPQHLVEQDLIVVAEFNNKTGDPIFDDTLKQAVSMELTQSPFLRVASDLQVDDALRRMDRSRRDPLSRDLTAEVCLRMGGKALLAGSVSKLGDHYILSIEALGCSNGERLAMGQAEAANKEGVLTALGHVVSQMRTKLGESLPSLQKYDFPVNATTSSLEALKAFTIGLRTEHNSGPNAAVPYYREAIELDPDFALAYATLGRAYEDFGEDERAIRNYERAFRLRERLSQREKYFVTTLYYETVPGDLEKAKQAGELWVATYPRDEYAREKLGTVYGDLGELEKGLDQFREALRLDPDSEINVFNASAGGEMTLNRLRQAEQILETAQSHGLNGDAIHFALYATAFQERDTAKLNRQVAWAIGRPGAEETLLAVDSDTQAYFGRIRKARELSIQATKSAIRDKATEMAALYQMVASLREIEVGNVSVAGDYARRALLLTPTRDVKIQAALAYARSGNATRARELLQEIEKKNPANTLVNSYWGPAIEASLEIQAGNPSAALSKLQVVSPYEFSMAPPQGDDVFMYPAYIRGQAFLASHNGRAAASEFTKIVDHPGVVLNCILGALAPLQLARAQVMAGDKTSARRQYQEFLTLWKDADPDIPVLREAKLEYEKIK